MNETKRKKKFKKIEDKRKPLIAKQHCDMAIVRKDEDYHSSTIVKERPLGAHRGGEMIYMTRKTLPAAT